MTVEENNFGAKNEVALKPETRALPSNIEDNNSKGMKELAAKQKNKIGEKTEEARKPETRSIKEFERDTDNDSDQSVKVPRNKKTKQGVLHDSEDDNDDVGEDRSKITRRKHKSEADLNTNKTKKQKRPNKLTLHCQRGGMV